MGPGSGNTMTASPPAENVKSLETSARTFSAIPSDRIWARRRAALNFSAKMSRRKFAAHLSMLYLIMLMSDIDFSRISAKLSDKGPPCDFEPRQRGVVRERDGGPRFVHPKAANDCHVRASDEGASEA